MSDVNPESTCQSVDDLRALLRQIDFHMKRVQPGWSPPEVCSAVMHDVFMLTDRVRDALRWAIER